MPQLNINPPSRPLLDYEAFRATLRKIGTTGLFLSNPNATPEEAVSFFKEYVLHNTQISQREERYDFHGVKLTYKDGKKMSKNLTAVADKW